MALEASLPDREKLSPIDIACLLLGYAQFGHAAGPLLELCSQRLKGCHQEVSGANCASILNSYARLNECNPEIFELLAQSVLQTKSESLEVHHVSVTMNAFAKCHLRHPGLMRALGTHLESRVQLMSPQNVSNVAHACARLAAREWGLLKLLQARVASEDLGAYKLPELVVLVHSLAKLRCRGPAAYGAICSELARRQGWQPRDVAQVLDAARRKAACRHQALMQALVGRFLGELRSYGFEALSQAARYVVEMDDPDLAGQVPPGLAPAEEGETASRCVMRLVLERMREMHEDTPFTSAQRCAAQTLVRAYRYKHEVDYNLQPHRLKGFCRSLFDVPSSLVSSVARPGRQQKAAAVQNILDG